MFISYPIHCPFTSLFRSTYFIIKGLYTVCVQLKWTYGVALLRVSPTYLPHSRFYSRSAWCGRAQDVWLSRKPPNWQVLGGLDSTCSCRGPTTLYALSSDCGASLSPSIFFHVISSPVYCYCKYYLFLFDLLVYSIFAASWALVLPYKVLIFQLLLGLNARSQVKTASLVAKT